MGDEQHRNGDADEQEQPPRFLALSGGRRPATWQELAEQLGTLAASHDRHLPWLRTQVEKIALHVGALETFQRQELPHEIRRILREVIRAEGLGRHSSPSSFDFDPDKTDGGTRMVPEARWNAIQTQVEQLVRARELAEAEARGAKAALDEQRRRADEDREATEHTQKRITTRVAIIGAACTVLATAVGILSHFWH